MRTVHFPSYLTISNNDFSSKIEKLYELMFLCRLCPRKCGAKRLSGEKGLCGADDKVKIASVNVHLGEEPPISGKTGSGTIFFSGCPLKCKFCQNYPISRFCAGKIYDVLELAEAMVELQRKGANNINLVTSTHFMPFVVEALFFAKKDGLNIPLVYNSSGYESEELIELLDKITDIYLPDIKYSNDLNALKYSGVKDYVENNRTALKAIYKQVGDLRLNKNGIAVSGMMIRHLVLPGNISGYADSFRFIKDEIGNTVPISLMSQYFPAYKAQFDQSISRKITEEEYELAISELNDAGLSGYCQDNEL